MFVLKLNSRRKIDVRFRSEQSIKHLKLVLRWLIY